MDYANCAHVSLSVCVWVTVCVCARVSVYVCMFAIEHTPKSCLKCALNAPVEKICYTVMNNEFAVSSTSYILSQPSVFRSFLGGSGGLLKNSWAGILPVFTARRRIRDFCSSLGERKMKRKMIN